MAATFITVLEADLRNISAEARKRYPAVKDAAERGILKLRSVTEPAALAHSDEVLKTFLLACETKNVKLSTIGLACLQKLIAHDAVSSAALPHILGTLEQHSEIYDESVQLKTLQTSLTVLQSSLHPDKEDDVAVILGICFRLQGNQRCAESVHSTAAATLRQAVALVFDRVVSEEGLPSTSSRGGGRRLSGQVFTASEPAAPGPPSWDASSKPDSQSSRRSSTTDEEKAAALSARDKLSPAGRLGLKLFEDLIALSSGASAGWLHVPSLPRAFALDMLDWTLSHYISIFTMLPPFEQLLRQRVCSLLITSLRATAELEGDTGEPPVRRLLLRCVATVTRHYSALVTLECEVFLQMLIKNVDMELPLWNRIYVLEVLRSLCTEARVLRNIFSTFDMRPKNTNVVQDMSSSLARVVSILQSPELSEETLNAVASMFSSKAKGVEWAVECDTSGNPLLMAISEAQAIALAVEALLGIVFTVSTLADEAVDADERAAAANALTIEAGSAEASGLPEASRVEQLTSQCLRMVDAVWKTLLEALSLILSKSTSEAVVLEVLRGYQAFATACGVLHATEARDAFLASLCKFTIAYKSDPEAASMVGQSGVVPAGSKRVEGGDVRESVVLTPKNVQALRTLFNISHRLDSVLGPAWVLVLETLAALDRTLHAPHATTQETSVQMPRTAGSTAGGSSEFSILSTLDAQLFESTALMSVEAVRALLEALRQVSRSAVAGVSSGLGMAASGATAERGSQGTPKMFAVERMVDTVLHNLPRVECFWDDLIAHLVELAGHESLHVRMAAVDALDRSILAVLAARLKPGAATSNQGVGDSSPVHTETAAERRRSSGGASSASPSRWPSLSRSAPSVEQYEALPASMPRGPFESVVVAPLATLYSAGREVDVRSGALRVLLHALERHGERLQASWPFLLTLLCHVASDAEKDLLPLGFQSVRVIMSDCLSSVPPGCMAACVQLAGAYARQQADLNISLTAITLLWTTADFFGKPASPPVDRLLQPGEERPAGQEEAHHSEEEVAGRSARLSLQPLGGPGGHGEGFLEAASGELRGGVASSGGRLGVQAQELLESVFAQMQGLCTDERPEVRNSGVRTLFNTVVSHGGRLSKEAWQRCLGDLFLPLLDAIRQLAAGASRDEWVGRELGKQGGKAVHMLVHHSRNTAQKQWDETLVVFLHGITRLLKSYFPLLQTLDNFDQGWSVLLQFLGESIAEGSKEVALAAASSLHVVLHTHALKGGMPRQYWESAFDTLEMAVRRAALPESRVTLKARIELLENLAKLYQQSPTSFDTEDFLRVLAMVDCLARYPHFKEDSPAPPAGTLPQVQRVVLEVFSQLRPMTPGQGALWPPLLQQLLCYLPEGSRLRPDHTRVPERFKWTLAAKLDATLSPTALAHDSATPSAPAASGPAVSAIPGAGNCALKEESAGAEEGYPETAEGALSAVFAERVVGLLAELYTQGAPRHVQVAVLPDVLAALGRCMKTRRDAPESSLWRTAVAAFQTVVEAALTGPAPDWNLASPMRQPSRPFARADAPLDLPAEDAPKGRPRLWNVLAELYEEFLLGACGKPPVRLSSGAQAAESGRADEALELACLHTLTTRVLASCSNASEEVIRRLVGVVDRCAARTSALPLGKAVPANCSRFSLACLLQLFALCGRGEPTDELSSPAVMVGRIALPILIARCEYILHRFAEDESDSGESQLPQVRVEELITMLQELARLVLPPLTASVIDVPLGPRRGSPSGAASNSHPRIGGGGRTSWVDEQGHQLGWERAHLLMLYTPLCEMVLSREARIRELALVLFRLIGAELGLVKNIMQLPT